MFTFKLLRYFIVLALVNFHHARAQAAKKETTAPMQIALGDSGALFADTYAPFVKKITIAGLKFFDIDWKAGKPGRILIRHGNNGVSNIKDVLHVSAVEDVDFRSEGVSEIKVTAELSQTEFISHEEARGKVQSLLDRIRKLGWKTTIPRDEPRLHGKAMLTYALNRSEFTTLDSAYRPTMHEWMSLTNSAKWAFHLQDTFLEISFTRDRAFLDPDKPGVYLLNYVFKNQQEYFRSYVQSKDRGQWMRVLPVEIANIADERALREAALKAEGIPIDETYLDPSLPKK